MKREIPKKNYIIFCGIAVITLFLVLYVGSWYKTTNSYIKNNSPLLSVISEISIDELDSYIIDNPNAVIYISENNNQYKDYELELKDLIVEYNLKNELVYIYLNDNNLETIRSYYKMEPSIDNNLVIFENGIIKYTLASSKEDFTKEKTLKFLIEHEMID